MKRRYYEDWSKSYKRANALEDFGTYLKDYIKGKDIHIHVDINDTDNSLTICCYDCVDEYYPIITLSDVSTAEDFINDSISDCETLDDFYNGRFGDIAEYYNESNVVRWYDDEAIREEAADNNIPYTNKEDVTDKLADISVDELRGNYFEGLEDLQDILYDYLDDYYDEEKYYDETLYDRI